MDLLTYHLSATITEQPALPGNPSQKVEDYVAAKFYCPHALADGN